jgi:hypothetical protein
VVTYFGVQGWEPTLAPQNMDPDHGITKDQKKMRNNHQEYGSIIVYI